MDGWAPAGEALRRWFDETARLMARALELESEDPVVPPAPGADVRARFDEPVPTDPVPLERLFEALEKDVLALGRRNGHPRFFGYVGSCADPIAVMADAVASALNQNVTAYRSAPGATELERRVVRWLGAWVGFGGDAAGLFTSGGSMANLAALAMALGRSGAEREAATVYLSTEAHLSLVKAARLLGVRRRHVRLVPVDRERRMDVGALERILRADAQAGLVPAAVVGTAGTIHTGAVDPVETLAETGAAHGAWVHVDGAYGGPAAALPEYADLRRGLGRVDSLALDPHKWLFAPLDAGCLLFRDRGTARAVFRQPSAYTAVEAADDVEGFAFFDEGIELSRRFRALKVWAVFKARGVRALERELRRHIEMRETFDARVRAHPELEPLGSGLSISCFRYRPQRGGAAADPDRINRLILRRLNAGGRFFLSPTELDGRFALRVCIVGFRTRAEDLERLLEAVVRLGREAVSHGR